MDTLRHYEQVAPLFDYPGPDYPSLVRRAASVLSVRYPDAAAEIAAFLRALPSGDPLSVAALGEMQELFTRSFDVQALTTLSVGYVAFGDDYKRGELLVNLSREHRDAGVECGSELPDHLPNVLRLMARWQDQELMTEFVQEILHPSITKMIEEFASPRIAERNRLYKKHYKTLIDSSPERATIFRRPLAALATVLERDFGPWKPTRSVQENDFLRSVGRELELEGDEGRNAKSRSIL